MRKITSRTDPAKEILELEGKLSGPWVEELEGCWWHAVVARQPARVVLKAVTFIDDKGKKLLATMHESGTELEAQGCLTKGVVDEITQRLRR